jgi:cytochrome c oxidase assembly protein subunit 15
MAAVMWQQERRNRFQPMPAFGLWLLLSVGSLIQISLGALVRERVDFLETQHALIQANGWLNMEAMGTLFLVHRGMSMLLLAAHTWIWWKCYQDPNRSEVFFRWQHVLMILFLLQISTGALNTVFPFPMVARALHILLGSICFGIQCYLALSALRKTKNTEPGYAA